MNRYSDEFVREQAAGCETLQQLWHRLQWPDYQAVRLAAKRLGLNLPSVRPGRKGSPRPKQAAPKAEMPIPGKRVSSKGGASDA